MLELEAIRIWITRIGGVVGLVALGAALLGMWRASRRGGGRTTGQAQSMLRWSTYLLIGVPYFLVCGLLWKPLPLSFQSIGLHVSALIVGSVLYFSGISMYLWAWFALGRTYNVSSGFGVRLFEEHELVREGPYAFVRHPMYVGFQVAAFSGILLFQTWTFVFLFVNFLFLVIRARREEQALAMEFPDQWEKYCKEVPAWFPGFPRKKNGEGGMAEMAMNVQPILETKRLLLRPFNVSDAGRVQTLAGDKYIASTTIAIPHPYENGMAEDWIRTHQEAFEKMELVTFAIVVKSSGELIGAIGLTIRKEHVRAEMGYWVGKPYWNQGYCTEAANEIIRYAFDVLALNRVHAMHLSRNPASGKVMRKIGMKYEGKRREHILKWGIFEDVELYGLLKSEYANAGRTDPGRGM